MLRYGTVLYRTGPLFYLVFTLTVSFSKFKTKIDNMAEEEDIAALVIDNGSGMCKGKIKFELYYVVFMFPVLPQRNRAQGCFMSTKLIIMMIISITIWSYNYCSSLKRHQKLTSKTHKSSASIEKKSSTNNSSHDLSDSIVIETRSVNFFVLRSF